MRKLSCHTLHFAKLATPKPAIQLKSSPHCGAVLALNLLFMDISACACQLDAVVSVDDRIVLTWARSQVCVIYIIAVRCCWLAWTQRATIREFFRWEHLCRSVVNLRVRTFRGRSADPFTERVDEMVKDTREKRCKMFISALSVWFLSGMVYCASLLHSNDVWGERDDMSLREVALQPSVNRYIVLTVLWVMLAPSTVSRRTMADVGHTALQVGGMSSLFFHETVEQFNEDVALVAVGRLMCAFFFGNTKLVFVLNLGHMVVFFLRVSLSDVLSYDVADMAGISVGCLLISVMVETYTRSEAVAQLRGMLSSQKETVVQDLLNIICDAVVFLDVDFNLLAPSAKLNDLLLRQATQQEFCGTSFPMLLRDSDRDRFLQFARGAQAHGQSLHVDMFDQVGSRVAVQLFHCSFQDLFAQTRHIIGIREEMESAMHREIPAGTAPLREIPVLFPQVGGSFTSNCSEELVSIRSCEGERVAVWFDFLGETLPVVGCTAGFTHVGGPIQAEESLLAWLNDDRMAFQRWIQVMVNTEDTETEYTVNLAPPHQHDFEIVSTCTFHVENGRECVGRVASLGTLSPPAGWIVHFQPDQQSANLLTTPILASCLPT